MSSAAASKRFKASKKRERPIAADVGPPMLTIDGLRYVLIREDEYSRMKLRIESPNDIPLPEMPPADADGNLPAVEAIRAMIARDIIAARRRLGLSQAELARRAGVRVETLNRIERMTHSPSVPTMAKIEAALTRAESSR